MKPNLKIPLLDLKREYTFFKKHIKKEIDDCLDSQQWILGPKVSLFEKKLAKYLGTKNVIGVASGTDALILSLRALALKLKNKEYFDKKDEIVTTPFTFIATSEAILRSGATPVFVDIGFDNFNVDPFCIEKAITKNTVGILPVHLYGLACNLYEICKIAKRHNLFIVEDAAQSFGGTYKDRKLGTIGDLGCFSFFPSKNLGGFGDGGAIATNNIKMVEIVKALRGHGQNKAYNASYVGYNSRLDAIQAAVLTAKLKYIDKFNKVRIKIAKKYDKAFMNIEEIKIPTTCDKVNHVYNLYTIKVLSRREEFLKFLNSRGIGARIYYPRLLSEMNAFKNHIIKGALENAKKAKFECLSLPLHPFLKNGEIDNVIFAVRKFFSRY